MRNEGLFEYYIVDMLAYEEIAQVAGFIPFRFARHIVGDFHAVDGEILEGDIRHHSGVVITGDYRSRGIFTVVGHIAEKDIIDGKTGCLAIFLIEENADIYKLAAADVFDTDIVESDVLYNIVVAAADAEDALIVFLKLILVENVEVTVGYISDSVRRCVRSDFCGAAVETDHDRMGDISP